MVPPKLVLAFKPSPILKDKFKETFPYEWKVDYTSLVELLVNRHEVSQEDADVFVREFFLLIEQALDADQYVKIKDWVHSNW